MTPEIGEREPDIRKAAVAYAVRRQLLVSRSKGKDDFVAPGGKLEIDPETGQLETTLQAAIREFWEEQGVKISEDDLELLSEHDDQAAGQEDKIVRITTYLYRGPELELQPRAEIAENGWVTSANTNDENLGSIFAHHVIPELVERDLID